ncbi:hypothetical protein CEP51_001466 [Fusarium floridanum]|uniref:Nephrocystin 3-like N-terminal domain-containing protein n=1 Tax=Fusarium floridanum TaxID=1325733 RepID=A0A428SGJ2_9HYPO|nr:hypothetical protein CEP51_001466 [Fusarium floridanum]
MDPVSAIGLASAIVSFVEIGVNLLRGAKEIRDSANDSLEKNESREVIVEEMKQVAAKLKTPEPGKIPPEQQKLCHLADKCNDLSQRILELLNKIKPKNNKPLSVYRAAYHAWRKEDEIEMLEKSLADCRSQLALSLTHLASKNSAEYSKRILAMVHEDSSKLEQLQAHIKQLNQGVEAQVIGNKALEQLRLVLGMHDEALSVIYKDRILRSLQFEDMHRRDDGVRDPYENTFKWILEDDDGVVPEERPWLSPEARENHHQDRMKRLSRNMLFDWLYSGSGIFHISGKLGSGKSTLMKFLSTHPRTRAEIEKWSGHRTLLLASFFFWKPGSELQKSLEGLFRSLLCDILTACPDLIPDTLPEYWCLAEKSPWQIRTKFNISASTIKSALKKIISDERLYQDHRFCFFIDGLDEFEGTDGQDPTYLATLLNNWVNDSHGCLKLCVSSREHNVFMNAFPKDQRLRLHELTRFDMREYVAGLLQEVHNETLSEDFRNKLVTSISEKADGIFLWTIIVVKTIRRKVEDGEPEESLMKLLESLPHGLNSVLRHLLEDLDADNRRRLHQTMAMLRVAKANKLPFSLVAFSFLDDYEKDAQFSTKGNNISAEKTKTGAQRRLRGACGGLIEIEEPKARQPAWSHLWGRLEYTHRSVPEMFSEGTLKREMDVALEGFDAIDAISHLTFAAAQFLKDTSIFTSQGVCAGLARMRLENEIEEAPYPFLEHIASWFKSNSPPPKPGDRIYLATDTFSTCILGAATSDEPVARNRGMCYQGNMLCLAAYLGCFNYVEWKIQQRAPEATNSSLDVALLSHMSIHKPRRNPWTLDYLLDSGLLTDSTAISYVDVHLTSCRVQAGNLTTWQRFLIFEFLEWALADSLEGENERAGLLIQKFLEHGASSDFCFAVGHIEPDQKLSITLVLEGAEVILTPPYEGDSLSLSRGLVEVLREARGADMCTFRDWIQASDYPNKDHILELLGDDGKGLTVTSVGEVQV